MLLLLLAFGLCSLRKGVFVQFTADVLVLGVSLCQAFALKLAGLMLDGIPCLCSLHERSLAALLLDLVALKLLGQKQGFITRLLVAWRGLCLDNACLLALAFLACGGHHMLLRLLSLHLCNEYLSLPKKKKKKKTMLASLWLCLADPTLCHALLVDRNKHVFLAGRLALV